MRKLPEKPLKPPTTLTYKIHFPFKTVAKKAGDRIGWVTQPTVQQADISLTITCHVL